MNPLLLLPLSLCILSSCTLPIGNSSSVAQMPQSQSIAENTSTATWVLADTSQTARILRNAYSEEALAETIYTEIVAKYPTLSEINNIIDSEEKHSVQVGKLLDARGIVRPTDFGIYTDTYATLSAMVESSLTGAIEAGVMIEVGDIDHLLTEYQTLSDTDIRQVFENIGGGSFNHLRAFLRFAKQYNYTPTTEYSRYMSPADLSSKGSLKYKMTELLEANNLPTSGVSGGGQGQGSGRGRMNQ